MNNQFQKAIEQLIPFIVLGVSIAFALVMLVMFLYVLIWGFIIGCVIWLAYLIKNYLLPAKTSKKKKSDNSRVIEHDDNDK
jgi:uncharacterized membrane protein YqgA involved in biofilm formation